jgi:hypothetical protein
MDKMDREIFQDVLNSGTLIEVAMASFDSEDDIDFEADDGWGDNFSSFEKIEFPSGDIVRKMYDDWFKMFLFDGMIFALRLRFDPETSTQFDQHVSYFYPDHRDDIEEYVEMTARRADMGILA